MTESRIKEIAKQHHCDWVICHEAMKQAVNEALDEASEKAEVEIKSGDHTVFNLHVLFKEKDNYVVDKMSILKQKVK